MSTDVQDNRKLPLHFVWIVGCSTSMRGRKIEALNLAIREWIARMRYIADENPNAEALVRAIRFSDGAQWHISQPTEIHSLHWIDFEAAGERSDIGEALRLVADALKLETMPERALPPVLVLISDGPATDDFDAGLKALLDQPWGREDFLNSHNRGLQHVHKPDQC